jgi:two-component system, LuxR family, sensor kinase FixL
MRDLLSVYAPVNRTRMLVIASLLIAAIAAVDWWVPHYISLGFLYLFPIIIVGGFLSRPQIVGVALVCAVLQEAFGNLPENEAVIRLLFSSAGFVGTGLFISEMVRNRRIVLKVHDDRRQSRARDCAVSGKPNSGQKYFSVTPLSCALQSRPKSARRLSL